jgi:hypothetical protein
MIVDRVLRVANASGVAIGLLETNKNELVYKAASGSAAQDIGRHVSAVLSCSSTKRQREILRVENAESDKRIEAEICRQFGAQSLLMLPIYKEHVLLGVLQVLFDEAHSFADREIRAYRLIVGALEEGLLRSAQHPPKPQPASIVQAIPTNAYPQQDPRPVRPSAEALSVPAAATRNLSEDLSGRDPESFAEIGTKSVRDYSAILAARMRAVGIELKAGLARLAGRPWADFPGAATAIGVVIVLWISIGIFHQIERKVKINLPGSTPNSAALQTPVKAIFNAKSHRLVSKCPATIRVPNRGFRRVWVSPHEVDYVTDDVTIRTFDTSHAEPQLPSGTREVEFGDDVTVRYFAQTPARKASSSASTGKPENN